MWICPKKIVEVRTVRTMSNTNSLNVAKLGKATPHQNPPSPSAENTTALWIPAVRSAILTANHPGTDAAPKMVVSPHGPHSHHQPHILVPFAKWNQMPVLGDLGDCIWHVLHAYWLWYGCLLLIHDYHLMISQCMWHLKNVRENSKRKINII